MPTKTTTTKPTADVEPEAPARDVPEAPARDVPNVFAVYKRMTQGDKLRLMQTLNVGAAALGSFPEPAFLVAVAWKHRKSTTGQASVGDLLELDDAQILELIGVTEADLEQQAAVEREDRDEAADAKGA